MYSGTGVWVGQAHWQSTTLWKYCGLEMSVGAVRPLLRAAMSLACITSSLCLRSNPSSYRTGMRYPNFYISSRVVFSTGNRQAATVAKSSRQGRHAACPWLLCGAEIARKPGCLAQACERGAHRGGRRKRRTIPAADSGPRASRRAVARVGRSIELDGAKEPNIDTGLQHLVLLVGDAVADVVVEEVLGLDANGDLRHQVGVPIELGGVAELGVEQVVAGGRRVERGELVLCERVQKIDPRKPVDVPIVDAPAQPMRRHLRDV